MAHFAKIIDGKVVAVITADDDFVLKLDGTWLKTSYNTHGGVHYGQDGLPDGLPQLRKNYANVGDVYDPELDAFYKINTEPFYYLDKESCTWKPTLPNIVENHVRSQPDQTRKKIYITDVDQRRLGKTAISNLKRSLDVEIVNFPAGADIALPFSDWQTQALCNDTAFEHVAPMSATALETLTDRIDMQALGIPILPTYMPKTEAELLALPAEPIFVKRRKTYYQANTPWEYQAYENPQALLATLTNQFWDIQNSANPKVIPFVIQPALAHPFEALTFDIAINKTHEVLMLSIGTIQHEYTKKLGDHIPYEGELPTSIDWLAPLCSTLQLGAGIHEFELVSYQGEWCLLDWNARLTGAMAKMYASVFPVLDDAILHMLGEPLREEYPTHYSESKSFRTLQLSREYDQIAMECGLFPRCDDDTPQFLARVSTIAVTKEEVKARLALFESRVNNP